MVRTIVGANWGDEGKGKVTDLLAEESDVVVRFQGGANAGHTIINEYGKFALHLLPSGVFHQNVVNVIGPGVALNIEALLSELESLTSRGVPMPKLMISDRCQVMMPYHIAFDKLEEERLGKSAFGSTKSGIAPFYSDKYAKVGIQVCQLYDEELLRKRLEIALVKKNVLLEHLYHQPPIDVNELVPYLQGLAEKIRPMVADTTHFLYQANKEGKTILLAGHNNTFFNDLQHAEVGATVTITTHYGVYTYEVTEMKVMDYQDETSYDFSRTDENLILYTCYPFDALGFTPNRYFVYAKYVSGPVLDKNS